MLAIGILFAIVSLVTAIPMLKAMPNFFEKVYTLTEKYKGDTQNNPQYTEEATAILNEWSKSFTPLLISSLLWLLQLSTALVFSIFANYWYKELAIRKIKEVKNYKGNDLSAIAAAGGTKAIIWVLILISYIVIYIVLMVAYCSYLFSILGNFVNNSSQNSFTFFSSFIK